MTKPTASDFNSVLSEAYQRARIEQTEDEVAQRIREMHQKVHDRQQQSQDRLIEQQVQAYHAAVNQRIRDAAQARNEDHDIPSASEVEDYDEDSAYHAQKRAKERKSPPRVMVEVESDVAPEPIGLDKHLSIELAMALQQAIDSVPSAQKSLTAKWLNRRLKQFRIKMMTRQPAVNVVDKGEDDQIHVYVDVPGCPESSLSIEFAATGTQLVVSGKRKPTHNSTEARVLTQEISTGHFLRIIPLPADVDREQELKYKLKDGVLHIRVAKLH